MALAAGTALLVVLVAAASWAKESAEKPSSGAASRVPPVGGGLEEGPSSTVGQLGEDAWAREDVVGVPWLDDTLEPYFRWKQEIQEGLGLDFGGDYTALYEVATSSPDQKQAAGGIFRTFGAWQFVDRGGAWAGSFVFKGENRHSIGTDVAPLHLGFVIGSAVPTGVPFSDSGWLLTNLFWKQKLGDRATLQFGQVDPTDYVDLYGLVNPWTAFTNLAFLTSPTIPVPDQGLGAALGAWLTDEVYFIGGFSDPTANPHRPFDDFFGEGEFFTHGEIGWTTARDRLLLDNVHVTGWHIDERAATGAPAGWGLAFSGTWFFADRWMPFLRGGYADEGGALLDATVAAGVGMLLRQADLLGLGLGWGRPQPAGASDQYTAELFYRWHPLPSLAITPDVQVIVDPPGNPDVDVAAVFGLRVRLAL